MELKKIIHFPLTKIVIGILVVGGSVAFGEWVSKSLLDKISLSDDLENFIMGITAAAMALVSYILLFRFYEKRHISELSLKVFWKNAIIGFLAGLILQSLLIVVIYITGGYSIIRVNPVLFLLPAFTTAFAAGFVAEILIRGIIFRLIEEYLGTVITIIITVLLFAVLHAGNKGATLLSVLSTSIQAGFLLSAAYVFSRSLWLPIFLHFAWDFAEPGIYGAINPGNTIEKSLFTSKISGPELLTGGELGPQNSIQSAMFCLIVSLLFLWLAKRKNNFINPFWKKNSHQHNNIFA